MPNKNTLFVGKVFLSFPRLGSTNQYAQEILAKSDPAEGTVISAGEQTAGRGQIGSAWESEPNANITMSVIFFPTFLPPVRQFLLTKAFSLAVRDALAAYLPQEPAIKWPNDIYAGDRKITGILLQNAIGAGVIQSCIAGFGVNVNQRQFPPHLPNPTSLWLETGRTHNLRDLMSEICQHLEFRYLQLRRGDHAAIDRDYLGHLYAREERRRFQPPGQPPFWGRITGVDPNGCLRIQMENGASEAFSLKEIQLIL